MYCTHVRRRRAGRVLLLMRESDEELGHGDERVMSSESPRGACGSMVSSAAGGAGGMCTVRWLLLAQCLLACASNPRATAPQPQEEDGLPTLFLNEDYSVSAAQIEDLGRDKKPRYTFVWGASPALMPAWTSLPAAVRPSLSWYMPYSRDISPVSCRLGAPGAQGGCVRGHNISWYEKHRRSWVLRKCDRTTPAFQYGDPNVPLDFTRQEVIDYQAELAVAAYRAGYSAIAADNLAFTNFKGFNACGVWRNGSWSQLFSGAESDPTFAQATVRWAELFQAAIRAKTGGKMRLVINFSARASSGNGGASPLVARLSNATDGVLDEFGFVNINTQLAASDWADKVRWMQTLGRHGVAYYSNNYLPGNLSRQLPSAGVEWALASYCMGWNSHSSLLVTPWRDAHVGNWSYRPELHTALGNPLGEFEYLDLGGGAAPVFRRNFSGSVAVVNPGVQPVTVPLDGAYSYAGLPPAGVPVQGSELRLEAQSARVLLRSRHRDTATERETKRDRRTEVGTGKQTDSAIGVLRVNGPCKAGCGARCPGDLCCSLNGAVQQDGSCKCSAPWHGARCEQLGFRPVRRPQGYGIAPAVSSWGGDVLFDGASFHLYVAAMTNNCSLSSWETNSRIEHAVSQSVTGPYVRSDVAVNTWSHNPVAMQLPGIGSPRFALLHIGSGSGKRDGGANCSRGAPFDRGAPLGTTAGATIHVSDSLAGPWRALLNSTLGPCNNPSPWVHRNGTIFLVCSGGPSGNGLWRAERIWGPWSLVTATLSAPGGVFGVYEDPYLYMSGDTFHLLFHVYETGEPGTTCTNSTVSAHLFSLDGYDWHTTPTQPYGTVVPLTDGTNFTVATRERPKFYFDPQTGQPTHLINGVSALASCWHTDLDRTDKDGHRETETETASDRETERQRGRESAQANPPAGFPPAPAGWQRFLGHCMSENPCTIGCNCASNDYIRNFSKCGTGAYPTNCFREAEAACSADERCASFAISRYLGGSFETYAGLLNDSAVPNADWTAYAKRCNLPPSQCRPAQPPAPPACVWRKPGDCVEQACVNCKFHGTTFTLVAPLAA